MARLRVGPRPANGPPHVPWPPSPECPRGSLGLPPHMPKHDSDRRKQQAMTNDERLARPAAAPAMRATTHPTESEGERDQASATPPRPLQRESADESNLAAPVQLERQNARSARNYIYVRAEHHRWMCSRAGATEARAIERTPGLGRPPRRCDTETEAQARLPLCMRPAERHGVAATAGHPPPQLSLDPVKPTVLDSLHTSF